MKKGICVLLAVLLCTAVAGCGNSSDVRPAQGKPGKTVDDVLNEKMNESKESAADPTVRSEEPSTEKETVAEEPSTEKETVAEEPVDIDLTILSSTMVYSEVYNMLMSPGDYLGKRVRMRGAFAYAIGDSRYYCACIIADATACCSQGIEFVLRDTRKFPDEYPEKGEEITVVGVFHTYTEGPYQYCELVDAVIETE